MYDAEHARCDSVGIPIDPSAPCQPVYRAIGPYDAMPNMDGGLIAKTEFETSESGSAIQQVDQSDIVGVGAWKRSRDKPNSSSTSSDQ